MKSKYYNDFIFGLSVFSSKLDGDCVRVRLFPSSRISSDVTMDYDVYIKLKCDLDDVLSRYFNHYDYLSNAEIIKIGD